MTSEPRAVYGGVDTHRDIHVAAALDHTGRLLGTETFPATPAGYRQLHRWLARHGTLAGVGVEGTGSYGLGLARHLADAGVEVVEVNRPNRQTRRRRGKNDTIDAEAAARSALSGDATAVPKSHAGSVESIRVLRIAFRSSRNTRTKVINQLHALVISAPGTLRSDLEELSNEMLVQRCSRFRPGDLTDPVEATKAALRTLARHHQMLTDDIETLRTQLEQLTRSTNPSLCAALGVGSDVASILLITAGDNPERLHSDAAFAALCGVSPIEASSGRVVRHRLNRGGDRQANHALWRIAMVRWSCDPRTKAYIARRRAEGRTNAEILRALKRHIAREIYRLLTNPQPVTSTDDLRPRRLATGTSLRALAQQLGTQPARISELELGTRRPAELEANYRAWLDTHAA